MTAIAAAFLTVKVTLVLGAALVVLRIQPRASTAARHLVCLSALAASILFAPTLFETAGAPAWRIAVASVNVTQQTDDSQVVPYWALIRIVWGAGVLLLLARLAAGYWYIARIIKHGAEIASAGEIPIRRGNVPVPLAAGLFRPVIVLPLVSEQWTDEVRRAVVCHERAHIERGDRWANLLANVACALYWFHPFAWMVRASMHAEQEVACDDIAIESGFTPEAYGEALLTVAKGLPRRPSFSASMADPMANNNVLRARISRLAAWQPARSLSLSFRGLMALAPGIALLTALALLGPAAAQQKVYKFGNGVSAPRVIEKTEPSHAPESYAKKISGTVGLSLVVGADGRAHDVKVVKSLDPDLDANAAEAIQQWRFAPGQFKGNPVPVRATIQIDFRFRTGENR